MTYAYLNSNGTIAEYPIYEGDIKLRFRNTSFPSPFSPPDGYVAVTDIPQPSLSDAYHRITEGAPVIADGRWVRTWTIVPLTQPERDAVDAAKQAALRAEIITKAQSRLDEFAQKHGYDDIHTAASYASDPDPTFAAEGARCRLLRSQTWAALRQLEADVLAGTRSAPTSWADVELLLPVLTWTP